MAAWHCVPHAPSLPLKCLGAGGRRRQRGGGAGAKRGPALPLAAAGAAVGAGHCGGAAGSQRIKGPTRSGKPRKGAERGGGGAADAGWARGRRCSRRPSPRSSPTRARVALACSSVAVCLCLACACVCMRTRSSMWPCSSLRFCQSGSPRASPAFPPSSVSGWGQRVPAARAAGT
jgi:hypothetical protein